MRTDFGILLVNLGTPKAAEPQAVGRYLREFLMDPYVIDIPWLFRWILVHILIVPRRKFASAEAYQKVFSHRGSPLLYHSLDLLSGVRQELVDIPIELGMRYGDPSISAGLSALAKLGVKRALVVPLYPQYALSSNRTAMEAAREAGSKLGVEIVEFPAFYSKTPYIDAMQAVAREATEPLGGSNHFDHWLISFHGLPVRHITKLDPSKAHCLKSENCCDLINENNQFCYRAHCLHTARGLASRLNLADDKYTISFQSRLGRAEWLEPNTEVVLKELAEKGIRRLAVVCPSFVSDCLETLEEIQMRGREIFLGAGGAEFYMIPSLNAHPVWVKALASMLTDFMNGRDHQDLINAPSP